MSEVESRVNEVLLQDLVVTANVMSQEQARSMGAMALFGEKYGDKVRVVSIGDWAHELCGGTHAARSGQLGVVTFLSEGSVGAGVRRVEALVGTDAYEFLAKEHILVSRLTEMVKAPADQLIERIDKTLAALKDAERELAKARSAALGSNVDALIGAPEQIGPVQLWCFTAPAGTSANDLREVISQARGKQAGAAALVGFTIDDGKVAAVAAATKLAVQAGVDAGEMLQLAMAQIDGRGGGKADLAQGGGSNPNGIAAAFQAITAALVERFGA